MDGRAGRATAGRKHHRQGKGRDAGDNPCQTRPGRGLRALDRGGRTLGLVEREARVADVAQAFLRVALETASEQRHERGWRRGGQSRPLDVLPQNGRERVGNSLAVEQPPPREQLEQDHAERPDVRTLVHGAAARLLGGHVGGRAEQHAHGGGPGGHGGRVRHLRAGIAARRVAGLCEPEVEHLQGAVGPLANVRGLQVAVHDARLMRGFERVGHLAREDDHLGRADRPVPEARGEILAFYQFHHDGAASGLLLHPKNLRDVRVVEGGERAGLALESREALGVGGQRFGQHLDGDVAGEAGISRPIHLAHAAGTQDGDDFIGAQSCPGGQRHRGNLTYRRGGVLASPPSPPSFRVPHQSGRPITVSSPNAATLKTERETSRDAT
jgi:hypothetical protein